MGMFNGIISRKLGNKKQKQAAEILADMVKKGNGEEGGSVNPSAESQKIQVINFDWPSRSGQEISVNTEQLGLTEKDFIIPLLNVGSGYRNFLPWQILSLKALSEQGEWNAKFNRMGVDYNLTIGCRMEQVPVDDPEDLDMDEFKIIGVYIFYTMVEAG